MSIDKTSVVVEVRVNVSTEDLIKAAIEMIQRNTGMQFKPEHAQEQTVGQYDEAKFDGYLFTATGEDAKAIMAEAERGKKAKS